MLTSIRLAVLPVLSAAVLGIAAAMSPAGAGTLNTLYSFTNGLDGSGPHSAVVRDASGTLYGVTETGGGAICADATGEGYVGCGTLYSFNPAIGFKTLVEFSGVNGALGIAAPLLVGNTLYGSTLEGGAANNGVLYSVRTDGTGFTILHNFTADDGSGPTVPLAAGPGGVLYGVTGPGGPAYASTSYGVLFRITLDGTYSILHVFTDAKDGGDPTSLVVEKSGLIVGGTYEGGNKTAYFCAPVGCGTVFTYDPTSGKFTVLHTFNGKLGDGGDPILGSLAADGTVYGNAYGNFFSIGPKTGFSHILTTSYPAGGVGYSGNSGPTLGKDGSLTQAEPLISDGAGSSTPGDLYQQLNGIGTILWRFSRGADGGYPYGQPLISPTGTFIGTTAGGGPNPSCSCGTIYEYTP